MMDVDFLIERVTSVTETLSFALAQENEALKNFQVAEGDDRFFESWLAAKSESQLLEIRCEAAVRAFRTLLVTLPPTARTKALDQYREVHSRQLPGIAQNATQLR